MICPKCFNMNDDNSNNCVHCGNVLKEQVVQIISLLIPMLVISLKRAADLADAMEARGYIPGAPRSKLNIMKFKLRDIFVFFVTIVIFTLTIIFKVI